MSFCFSGDIVFGVIYFIAAQSGNLVVLPIPIGIAYWY